MVAVCRGLKLTSASHAKGFNGQFLLDRIQWSGPSDGLERGAVYLLWQPEWVWNLIGERKRQVPREWIASVWWWRWSRMLLGQFTCLRTRSIEQMIFSVNSPFSKPEHTDGDFRCVIKLFFLLPCLKISLKLLFFTFSPFTLFFTFCSSSFFPLDQTFLNSFDFSSPHYTAPPILASSPSPILPFVILIYHNDTRGISRMDTHGT